MSTSIDRYVDNVVCYSTFWYFRVAELIEYAWGVAQDRLVVDNSRIREYGLVEDADGLVMPQVYKVRASDSQLGVARLWTAYWLHGIHDWGLVVEVGDR